MYNSLIQYNYCPYIAIFIINKLIITMNIQFDKKDFVPTITTLYNDFYKQKSKNTYIQLALPSASTIVLILYFFEQKSKYMYI